MFGAGDGAESVQQVRRRDQAGAAGEEARGGGAQEAAGGLQGEGKLLQERGRHFVGTTPSPPRRGLSEPSHQSLQWTNGMARYAMSSPRVSF
ncbi:unnamed protein product [Ixodes pacificus]